MLPQLFFGCICVLKIEPVRKKKNRSTVPLINVFVRDLYARNFENGFDVI